MRSGDRPRLRRSARPAAVRLLVLLALLALLPVGAPAAARERTVAAKFDLSGDGIVSNEDVMIVVNAWTTARENGACGASGPVDVNGDGCLTVGDIAAVSARLGMTTTTRGTRPVPGADAQTEAFATTSATSGPIVVTSTGDGADAVPADGICATATGECTLRAAIVTANRRTGPDTIAFAIPGAGPHAIAIASELPAIADPSGGTLLDGYSQPGASPNSDPVVSNAVIMVQIVGPRAVGNPTSINGITITSANNTVRGIALLRLRRSIWLSGTNAAGNQIVGNFVGAGADGQPWYDQINTVENRGGDNGAFGIWFSNGAHDNQVGGTDPAARNVISGNANDGVGMRNAGTSRNVVVGNLIGMSPDGTLKLRNWGDGVDMNYSASANRIGGNGASERNVITGNVGEGIEISHEAGTTANQVVGNYIGVGIDGLRPADPFIRNNGYAISLEDGPANNLISGNILSNNVKGGIHLYGFGNAGNQITGNRIGVDVNGNPAPNQGHGIHIRFHAADQMIGPDNVIANNTGAGVYIVDSDVDFNTVTRNRIFANGGLGIDIDPIGVNGNDTLSHDGPNQRLNFPVIATATPSSVTGSACANCTVELFVADGAAGEHGEGRDFLASTVAGANGAFTAAVTVAEGSIITATATDGAGNTSEFGLNVLVGAEPPPPPVGTPVPGTIQAEDYNLGGEGVGYHDLTAGNTGGRYRTDGVDIGTCSDPTTAAGTTCYNVGWVETGEWLAYDISVAQGGTFTLDLRVATPSNRKSLRVELDGQVLFAAVAIPNTGGYQKWTTVTTAPFELSAGVHTVRIVANTTNWNFNYLTFNAAAGSEPPSTATQVPATIQAEAFNPGGEGVGFHDLTGDSVDLGSCSDPQTPSGETCTMVGWIDAGEWLAYDIEVEQAGAFTLDLRVATPSSRRSLAVAVDGEVALPAVAIPDTDGYQAWTTVTTAPLQLDAGVQTLTIVANTNNWNFNHVTVNAAQ